MADFAPLKSAEFTDFAATPPRLVPSSRWNSKSRTSTASLTFTLAGATGTAKMLRLPAGKVRVLVDKCRIVCPAGTATADLHVGYAAYTGQDGVAVVGDDNAFADNLDIGAGAVDVAFSLPTVGYLDLNSRDGVDIEIMIDTAASPAAGECWIDVTFQQGN